MWSYQVKPTQLRGTFRIYNFKFPDKIEYQKFVILIWKRNSFTKQWFIFYCFLADQARLHAKVTAWKQNLWHGQSWINAWREDEWQSWLKEKPTNKIRIISSLETPNSKFWTIHHCHLLDLETISKDRLRFGLLWTVLEAEAYILTNWFYLNGKICQSLIRVILH